MSRYLIDAFHYYLAKVLIIYALNNQDKIKPLIVISFKNGPIIAE